MKIATIHSTLDADALQTMILSRYDLGEVYWCKFWQRGLNDTYIAKTSTGKFVLRVYRAGWRTQEDIQYEVAMLDHLHQAGIRVASALPDRTGQAIHQIESIEGERYAVLFSFAAGKPIPFDNAEQSERFGALIAQIHQASDRFVSPYRRLVLDLNHLIYEPMAAILTHLEAEAERTILQQSAERLVAKLSSLPLSALDTGFCHGDTHNWNAHVGEDGSITMIDFDCSGVGWRAYDLGVFLWSSLWEKSKETAWQPFLRGYTNERSLNEAESAAIPLFAWARQLWFLGLRMANNPVIWGYAWTDTQNELKFLQRLEESAGYDPNI
ncbi:MAG: homoserine kinase [Caldilineaceae bacterium]